MAFSKAGTLRVVAGAVVCLFAGLFLFLRYSDLLIVSSAPAPQSEAPKLRAIVDEDEASARQPLSKVLDLDFKNDGNSYKKFKDIIRSRLRHGQFQELDAFVGEMRKTRARLIAGKWKLEEIYKAIGEPAAGREAADSDWETHLGLLNEWIETSPESITPRVAYANAMAAFGWKARTSKWVQEVSPDQLKLFDERLDKAAEVLIEASDLEEKCPEWFAAMQDIAMGQGWSRSDYVELFNDAVDFEPGYGSFYHLQSIYLLPRWYGEEGEWPYVLAKATDRLGTEEGYAMFHIAFSKTVITYYKNGVFAPEIKKYWSRIKQGYHARDNLYELTFREVDDYARMAYLAEDRPEARAAFLRLENQWNADLWDNSRELFDRARSWALQ